MFNLNLGLEAIPNGIEKLNQRLAMRAIIYNEKGQLLMVKNLRGDCKFPGGGVEAGEERLDCLAREVKEETGYNISEVESFIGSTTERRIDQMDPTAFFEMVSEYYLCHLNSEQGAQNLDEYEAEMGFTPIWINIDKAIESNKEVLYKKNGEVNAWVDRELRVLEILKNNMEKGDKV